MEHKKEFVTYPCDCGCCMFVVKRSVWEDGDVDYNISIQDSRYDHNYNTIWGRIKRACSALFGKPVYFSDAYIEKTADYKKLVEDMAKLIVDAE